uniref:mRNA splicing factor PRP22 n=1 Tax=Amorphochlora amoebiformis TaxID=1561963 RepID=A0A0H5BR35_9EUKA|nr:mRNA splicing factor PRP22 [Amorphochlora amoebiformis]
MALIFPLFGFRVRKALPIEFYANDLVKLLVKSNTFIVFGTTGSGKSTKIPQIIFEYHKKKKVIICTQPRRIAAVGLALRVSKEKNCNVGELVGFAIRFEDVTSEKTKIKYVTEGIIIKESIVNPLLPKYESIILDEAHERTINIDILFGILKKITALRKSFSLIISSATINVKQFSYYFNKCPIIVIPGKLYKITISYLKYYIPDYITTSIKTFLRLYHNQKNGHILMFLTGKAEIEISIEILKKELARALSKKYILIHPLYSGLSLHKQSEILKNTPKNLTKGIISTNIAETSLTIPGIKYVIDCGYYKCKIYNPNNRTDSLSILNISKSSANQRAGRAGRIEEGRCFRLFTEKSYRLEMISLNIPEIKRSNLTSLVLIIKTLGIKNILDFDFIDIPMINSLSIALEELFSLDALNVEGVLTKIGLIMSIFPLEPYTSRTLISSIILDCVVEVSLIAGLITNGIFLRHPQISKEKNILYDRNFLSYYGDHLTYLNVYKRWVATGYSSSWLAQYSLSHFAMNNVRKISKQLIMLVKKLEISIKIYSSNERKVCRSFTSGYYKNLAKRVKKSYYSVIINRRIVVVHPYSTMHLFNYPTIVFHNIINTKSEFIFNVCYSDIRWLKNTDINYL